MNHIELIFQFFFNTIDLRKLDNLINDIYLYLYHSIQPEYKSAVYYLYNCNYCMYNDFTSLEYHIGNNQDIYERVFIETKNDDRYNISINSFRSWIVKHYDEFNKNYNIIKMYILNDNI